MQKGQSTLEPRWTLELRCYIVILAAILGSAYTQVITYHLQVVGTGEGPLAVFAVVCPVVCSVMVIVSGGDRRKLLGTGLALVSWSPMADGIHMLVSGGLRLERPDTSLAVEFRFPVAKAVHVLYCCSPREELLIASVASMMTVLVHMFIAIALIVESIVTAVAFDHGELSAMDIEILKV